MFKKMPAQVAISLEDCESKHACLSLKGRVRFIGFKSMLKLFEHTFANLSRSLNREGDGENLFRLFDAGQCQQLQVTLNQQARLSRAGGSLDDPGA